MEQSIKIKIAEREFPLRVTSPQQEEDIRKAARSREKVTRHASKKLHNIEIRQRRNSQSEDIQTGGGRGKGGGVQSS